MITKRCLQLVLVGVTCLAPLLAQELPPITDHKTMAFQARARRHPDEYFAFKPLVEEAQNGNREALTALIELVRDPQTAWQASHALSEVGPSALPALDTLRSLLAEIEDPYPRFGIVNAIGNMGPRAEPAVGELADILRTEPKRCQVAANALATIGRSPGIAVPALAWAVENGGFSCQNSAVEALGSFQTMPAVEALTTALDAKHDSTRVVALESLGRIGPLAATAEDKVAVLLESENSRVRSAAELAMTLITGRLGAEDDDGDLRRAILSISDRWYAAHRDDLDIDGVCVSSDSVDGLFEVAAQIDHTRLREHFFRERTPAWPDLAAKLEPLVEELRQRGFSVRIDVKPCVLITASAAPPRSVQGGPH